MEIYLYSDTTGEFQGASITMLDPEETKKQGRDVWLMPPNATTIAPAPPHGCVAVWNGRSWDYIAAMRETVADMPPEPLAADKARAALAVLDAKSVRPARAVALAVANGKPPSAVDVARLADIEAEAQSLREELAAI